MGDQALVHRERVTVRGFIDHGGPGARDEVLVEFLASGEERIVPRDSLCPISDLVQGMRATGEVYLAGGRLDPAESLAVATHSPESFWWGNVGRAATQLGLALLLRATDRDTALAHYVAFTWQVIARLPQTDFELPVAAVHDWLASRNPCGRSFDGLCALVRNALGENPASRHWFVFVNRRGRPDALNDSGLRQRVIGFTPESVIGFRRIRRSDWTGIRTGACEKIGSARSIARIYRPILAWPNVYHSSYPARPASRATGPQNKGTVLHVCCPDGSHKIPFL